MGHDLSDAEARVVAVVQARMSSTRLPGKVLARIGEHTTLELLLSRLQTAEQVDEIVVATSTDPSDDPVDAAARGVGVVTVRGPLSDVLARFVQSAEESRADAVVRITADCPFTDPAVVDQVVRCWRQTRADYVTNTLEPRSYPDGFDVEVVSGDALRRSHDLAEARSDREHVTAYLRRHPELFSVAEVRLEPELGDVRVTLDTEGDLSLLRALVREVGPAATIQDVLRALGHDAPLVVTCRT